MWAGVGHWSLERDVAVTLQEVCEGQGNRMCLWHGRFAAALLWLVFGYVVAPCALRAWLDLRTEYAE